MLVHIRVTCFSKKYMQTDSKVIILLSSQSKIMASKNSLSDPDNVVQIPLSDYTKKLDGKVRERYVKKISTIGINPCPEQSAGIINEAMKMDLICTCKAVAEKKDKLVKCSNAHCTNGKFFHLSCLGRKRMPNNSKSWLCSVCFVTVSGAHNLYTK